EPQLGQQVAGVVLDRLLGQAHAPADLPVGQPLADQPQHGALLVGELGQPVVPVDRPAALRGTRSGLGVEERAAGGHRAHGRHQRRPAYLLEDVAGGAGPDRGSHRVGVGVAGQHQGAHPRHPGAQLAADLGAVAVGQPHVHDDDVRADGGHPRYRLGDRAGLTGDGDPGVLLEHLGHATTDDLVVVDEKYPYRGAAPLHAPRPLRSSRILQGSRVGPDRPGWCLSARPQAGSNKVAYSVSPGPNAIATTGPSTSRSSSSTSSTVADEQLPCSASTRREAAIWVSASPSWSRTTSRIRGPPGCTAQPATSSTRSPASVSSSSTTSPTCRPRTSGTRGDSPIRKPRSVTSQVMWSAVDGSVRATTPASRRPRVAPGSRTTAAAASENSACATTWSRAACAGWTCRLVSSQQSRTAGRPRAATKSAAADSPGIAA